MRACILKVEGCLGRRSEDPNSEADPDPETEPETQAQTGQIDVAH